MQNRLLTLALILGMPFAMPSISYAESAVEHFSPYPDVTCVVQEKENQIIVTSNEQPQILVKNLSGLPEHAREFWVEDYNFDGNKDIAVAVKLDPVSEDQYFEVFSWNTDLQGFQRLAFPTKLSNIELDQKRQEVKSAYLSKKFWTEDTIRFDNQIPYVFSRSDLIAIDIWHTTVFDSSGRILRSLVSKDGLVEKPPEPVITIINVAEAPLYASPIPSSMTDKKLTKDEVVTILDFNISRSDLSWVLIRTEIEGQTVQGWTLLDNLDLG